MVAAKGLCGEVWLIVHERNTNRFYSYRINQNGISADPVISDVGSAHDRSDAAWRGKIRMSMNQKKLSAVVELNEVEVSILIIYQVK